jgi:hypothetical protein
MALRKLTGLFGVRSYVILNRNGIPVQQHGVTDQRAIQIASNFSELALAVQSSCAYAPAKHTKLLLCPYLPALFGFPNRARQPFISHPVTMLCTPHRRRNFWWRTSDTLIPK